jgi:hypothetical protein
MNFNRVQRAELFSNGPLLLVANRGTNQYIGNFTAGAALVGCLCFCLPGLLILCCPCDERDAYKVNGQVYDAAGNCIGSAQNTHFIPRHTPMHR